MSSAIDAEKNKERFGSFVSTTLDCVPVQALIDSGNLWRCAISLDCASKLGIQKQDLRPCPTKIIHTAKTGSSLSVLGELPRHLNLRFGSLEKVFKIRPVVIDGLSMLFNISGPFLQANGIDLINSKKCIRIKGKEIGMVSAAGRPLSAALAKEATTLSPVYVGRKVILPPYSWAEFPLKVAAIQEGRTQGKEGLLIGDDDFMSATGLNPYRRFRGNITTEGWTVGAAMNWTDDPVTIPQGQKYGLMAIMPSEETIQVKGTPWTDEEKEHWLKREFRLEENPKLQDPLKMAALLGVLKRHWPAYSTDGSYGRTTLVKHDIITEPGPPIRMKFRPLNPDMENNLRQQVEEWLKHDVIEVSTSPWSFALVAVKKKNGKTRWTTDFRKLNKISMAFSHPLPNIEDNLARLANSKIFSTLDGMGAFHVVELTEEAKPKTAFSTPWGLYQFKRMPFGLSNGPATYSRLMQLALQGIPTSMCLPYLDDVIVHSATFSQHLRCLDQVLKAHVDAGLKLQPAKCFLLQDEAQYLGHIVSGEGVGQVPEQLEAIKNWPLPEDITQIRAFLGKCSYYRRFIADFSGLSKPWSDALKREATDEKRKDKKVQVTPEMERSFEKLKQALLSAPILAYPRFDETSRFILDTDWSQENATIGGVLSQEQDGEERVICYGAKKLSKSQANYPSAKGELFAVIYFMKHWRYYLQFRPFLLRTDNKALTWIKSMEHPSGMVLRWLETLAAFDFEVQHRAGVDHGNADALSRIHHAKEIERIEHHEELMASLWTKLQEQALRRPTPDDEWNLLAVLHQVKDQAKLPSTPHEWIQEQEFDLDLRDVKAWVQNDTWPSDQDIRGYSLETQHYFAIRFNL